MTAGTVDHEAAGRSCPYCRFALKEGAPAERCDSCGAVYHADCWRDGHGCAVLGCAAAGDAAGTATMVAPAVPQPAAAPPPPGPPSAFQPPPPPPPPRRRPVGLLIGLAAGLLVALGVAGALLLTGGDDGSGSTTIGQTTVTQTTVTLTDTSSTTTGNASGTTAAEARQQDLAGEIADILVFSQAGRRAVRAGRFQDAIDNREEVLSRIDNVSGTTGRLAAARRQLRAAMEASLASDKAYAANASAAASDARATRLKRSFVHIWNPVAASYGLPEYSETEV
jgi:hypothetical protein